jgi:DNA-binding response OmpR family regulator
MKKTGKTHKVLVIEDHLDIAENIGDYLTVQGHIVDFAMDGISGMHLALTGDFDVIILDLMLPGMDGLTLCRKYRQEADHQTPILMLTARDTLDDKLAGFETGADDYLVKPFALEELSVRITALAKRGLKVHSSTLLVGELELDLGTLKATREGKHIELNRTCLTILQILMKAYPNVVRRQELEQELWGDQLPGSDSLRSHLYALRLKIDKPFSTQMIETVHGIGYRLVEGNETEV